VLVNNADVELIKPIAELVVDRRYTAV